MRNKKKVQAEEFSYQLNSISQLVIQQKVSSSIAKGVKTNEKYIFICTSRVRRAHRMENLNFSILLLR